MLLAFLFFLFFYNLNSYQQLSHRPTWLSLLLSMLCIHPLSCQAKQPAPSRSIAAIKHGRKPVSVLLKQFSMAQGHSSNISFSCLPVQQRPGASCSWGEIVPILTSDPFDWLLYLGAERIGAGLTDWCLDAADDFVRVHRLALIPTLPPLSVWLTGTDAFWLEERKKKGKGKKQFGLSAEKILHNNIDFFQPRFVPVRFTLDTINGCYWGDTKQTFAKLS